MTLQLASRKLIAEDRSIVPACLQERAPVRYEIRDENDRRISPTLSGYCLHRGGRYKLRVFDQAETPKSWRMRLVAPRRLIEVPHEDMVADSTREISFQTLSFASPEPFRWLQSQTADLEVHMEFDDNREPFQFTIPVVVLAVRARLILYILGSLLIAVFTEWWRQNWTIPDIAGIAAITAILLGFIILVSLVVDHIRFHLRAQQLITQSKQLQRKKINE